MSGLILDTNVFAMISAADKRIPAQAMAALNNATWRAVSAITFYEISQKVRLGKWADMEPLESELLQRAMEAGIEVIPLTAEICQEAGRMEWSNRDPFDRMIAVSAMSQRLPLASSDRAFDDLDITRIWD